MATRQKRAPSNTANSAIEAAIAAASPLPTPPAHIRLDERHMPFWDGIVRERARKEWTPATLVVAAQLARCQYDIERETEELDAEGTVLEKPGRNDSITHYANPRVSVLEQLARREMALMRALGITGTALGSKADLAKGRQLEREAGQARDEAAAEDELLA